MLKIKVNKSEQSVKYEPVTGELYVKDGKIVIQENKKTHFLGDSLMFSRNDGSNIQWNYTTNVEDIEKQEGTISYVSNGIRDVQINVSSVELKDIVITPGAGQETVLIVNIVGTHDYIENRDDVFVSGRIGCSFDGINLYDSEYGCAGDYVFYRNYFLYKIFSVNSDGKYVMASSEMKNYVTSIWYYEGENKIFLDAIIPCTPGGLDKRDMMILRGDPSLLRSIADSPLSYTFYGNDERFFTEGQKVNGMSKLVLKQGAELSWVLGEIRVSVPFLNDFSTDAVQEEAISDFLSETSDSYINEIIDYEKQQFIPVFKGKDVSKIMFRTNVINGNETDSSIYALGFDWEDVYYRQKKVTETFLRVSIYNDRNRSKQKLLYTAKIFLNAGDLYGQYVDLYTKYTPEEALKKIGAEFTCTNKYDYYNSTEGFYFHLFPSNINDGSSGVVFMKCELNNAKYGYTTPMVWKRRNGYIVSNTESGNTSYMVSMKDLFEDMYVPIMIRKENERYVWEFDTELEFNDENDNTLEIDLYEPIINQEM